MSLLQENIVVILLIPAALQIVFPLAMLVVYVILSPILSLFKRNQSPELRVTEEFLSQESLA